MTDPDSICTYLAGVGLPAEAPTTAPPRPPPQQELDFDYGTVHSFPPPLTPRPGPANLCRFRPHTPRAAGIPEPYIPVTAFCAAARRLDRMTKRNMYTIAMGLLAILLTGGKMAMAEDNKRLESLRQPPLNTTMMGVLKGVADYHGLNLDTPMIYGLSGHAFLINIHTELCPSGPYCWKREHATPLIENMGMRMTDLGFFGTGATREERTDVERKLREALDRGIPCSLINMENQLIDGYDETGFFSAQPWAPHNSFPPATLSFGSWKEFGEQFHVNFYTVEAVQPADRHAAILASLDYAVDMWRRPSEHSTQAYGVGPRAYDNWIAAVPTAGSGHGNWWNATVWSECRRMAADYFSAIAKDNAEVADLCAQLTREYAKIAEKLDKASDKTMDSEEKATLLEETKQLEANAIQKVEKLARDLRTQQKP